MRWGSQLAEVFSPVVDFVYPPRCPLCGDAIAAQNGVCGDCWKQLSLIGQPWCARCHRPFERAEAADGGECAPCLSEPPRHQGIHAATAYTEASRKLVLQFKHGRKIAHARLMARMIGASLRSVDGVQQSLLVPVPLHRWRLWQRGFNQAALVARELERQRCGTLLVDGLKRIRRTPSLGGLGRTARYRALKNAIIVPGKLKRRIAGRRVVLVDDVLTSGATSDACVDALLGAGADSVRVACFARVLEP